jgi:hypothetical protein
LIKKIGESDVLVLSVSYSPAAAQFANDMNRTNYEETSAADLLAPLLMALKSIRKNVAKEIAEESGGEYATFFTDKRFEARVMTAARDARNRYLITFSPSDPTPGLHAIRVRTAQDYGARIVARADYWLGTGGNQ